MMTDRIITLFSRYMDGTASEAERYELSALALMPDNAPLIKELEAEYWEKMKEGGESLTDEEIKSLMLKVRKRRNTPIRFLSWRRIAVAASVVLAICTASYFIFFSPERKKDHIVQEQGKDIEAPTITKATITLADGRTVSVDSLTSLTQGDIRLVKTAEGKLVYDGSSLTVNSSQLSYNTLTNPRGSKVIDMTLSDGSHVWLNAGSSVTYPIAFIGNERKVTITGEAYFEVTHDASKPFYVNKSDMNVQVLGTKFNVNAYDDEPAFKVTLLEGSVNVSAGSNSLIIKPDQQAIIAGKEGLLLNKDVDVEEVMAWKNGRFAFGEKTDITTIMRQVARWYDVTVEYQGKVDLHFGGSMSRQVNVSRVLEKLEMTGSVKFKIEGQKIIVMP